MFGLGIGKLGSISTGESTPTASNVTFTGTLEVGETLTGSYTYSGPPESGTTFQWYRADDGSGTGAAAIVGATAETYELVEDDDTKYIAFGVTPSDGVETGDEVISDYQGPVDAAFGFISASSPSRVTTAENVVTAPAGIQDGDLLIAYCMATTAGFTFASVPTGFLEVVADTTGTSNTFLVYAKTANEESGDYSFTWSSAITNSIVILCYRGLNTFNATGALTKASSATATAASISPTVEGMLLQAFAIESATALASTPPAGTERVLSSTASPRFAIYEIYPSAAGATGMKSIEWSVSAQNVGNLIQITNE